MQTVFVPKPESKQPVERIKRPTPAQQIRLNLSKIVELSSVSRKVENLRRLGLLETEQVGNIVNKANTMIDGTKEEIVKTLNYI